MEDRSGSAPDRRADPDGPVGEYSEGGGPVTGPPPSVDRWVCPYWARNQSSMFHMSELVLGFLRKFFRSAATPRASFR